MHMSGEFTAVIKEIMKGDNYTTAILTLTPIKLRAKVGDSDLVDIVRHMVEHSTPEELAILYLRTIQEHDDASDSEELAVVVDKLLEDLDRDHGEE